MGPIERLSERMYLRLVDFTGRQIREDKRGHISPEVTPVLEALDIDVEAWVKIFAPFLLLTRRVQGEAYLGSRRAAQGLHQRRQRNRASG